MRTEGSEQQTNRLLRTYLWSRVQQTRVIKLIQSVFTGFWLGILSQSDLDSVDDEYYVGRRGKRLGPIDYTRTDYNKRGLFEWEQRAIKTHFPAGGSVALIGAGGGREVLALRRLAFRVKAWECQPEFVNTANDLLVAEGFERSVAYAPRNTIPAGTEIFDGLVIGWGTYTLISGRAGRIDLLGELRTRVDEGSPILLSFFTRRPGDAQFPIAAAVGNLARRILRRERLEVGDSLDPNFVHHFVESEVESELAAGGFRLEFFAAEPYGHAVALAVGPD
ncbi:MAG TPA: SAM-dependent methyltransferase [Acidimicrobiia bacterium]